MSTKRSRQGGKFTRSHTTVIPAAAVIADIAARCKDVEKISAGYIKAGLSSVRGARRLKIIDDYPSMLLSVRDNTSHQELRVYAKEYARAKSHIAKRAEEEGFTVHFQERNSVRT